MLRRIAKAGLLGTIAVLAVWLGIVLLFEVFTGLLPWSLLPVLGLAFAYAVTRRDQGMSQSIEIRIEENPLDGSDKLS